MKEVRPDLRLHGFGVRTTSLRHGLIRELLHTADSMAWSFNARMHGRNQHDYREALCFARKIQGMSYQRDMFGTPCQNITRATRPAALPRAPRSTVDANGGITSATPEHKKNPS